MENNLTCSYIFSLEFCIIYIFVYVSHLYFFINENIKRILREEILFIIS